MRELEREDPTTQDRARAHAAELPAIVVVGCGRVGGSIASGLAAAGVTVTVAGREDAVEACREAEVALLCVPDDAIGEAAATVAAAAPALRFAGHTSGATGLDALGSLAARGVATFSLHPLQTVPDGETDFTACPCAVWGATPEALALAGKLATTLGMRSFELADSERAAYHAAACIASNFLVAPDARELLAPLVLRTAANWSELGAAALTGPIARGDAETVERHLQALRERAPELLDLYEALAERTRATAPSEPGP